MRAEGTPVPIPNTTVKIRAADGTMLETAWESRRLPDIFLKKPFQAGGRIACSHAKTDAHLKGKRNEQKSYANRVSGAICEFR